MKKKEKGMNVEKPKPKKTNNVPDPDISPSLSLIVTEIFYDPQAIHASNK